MERVIRLGPCVVLIGAIGLLQAHGIAFWSSKLGLYGIGWSVLLEATALWLWSRPASGSRALACLASVLLLLGPLYQVGTPILDGLALAEHSDRARSKEIPMAKAQIRELEGQLAAFTANSEKRPGWLPAIEARPGARHGSRRRRSSSSRWSVSGSCFSRSRPCWPSPPWRGSAGSGWPPRPGTRSVSAGARWPHP